MLKQSLYHTMQYFERNTSSKGVVTTNVPSKLRACARARGLD